MRHEERRPRAGARRAGYHVPLLALITQFVGSRRATLGLGRYRKEDLVLVKELVDAVTPTNVCSAKRSAKARSSGSPLSRSR